jgi:outer membrane protein assembly factor BamB
LWWETLLDRGSNFSSLRLGDIDGDGSLEIVGGVHGYGHHVIALDAASGVEKWKSPNLDGFFDGTPFLTLLRVADIDGDGTGEILVTYPGADLLVLDPVGGTIDLSTTGIGVSALATADLDGNGVQDIVIGTEDGLLQQVNPTTGDAVTLGGPFGAPVDAVAVAVITEDSVLDFVICAADRVHLIDGATMEPLWVSLDLGTDVGRNDSLIVGDFDWDGRVEIWVNAGVIGHLMFEVVETGRAARWRRVPSGRRSPVRR